MESTNTDGKTYEFEKNHVMHPMTCGPFMLHQLTEVFCESNHRFGAHTQWCYEISYVISGTGYNRVDSKCTPVSSGDLFLTPVGSLHEIESADRLRYLCIGFDIDLRREGGKALGTIKKFFDSSPTAVVKGTDRILSFMQAALDDQYNRVEFCEYSLEKYISLICAETYRCFTEKRRLRYLANESESLHTYGMPLYSALLYIDTNISRIKDITSLAGSLGYNPCYLSHLFRKNMGVTLQQYICSKRIDESIKLVYGSRQTLGEAAKTVGFNTSQAYSKAFRRVKGVCPREYFKNANNTIQEENL